MKIIEVRDGFIKFESNKTELSSLVQINDSINSYIAQVVQIKRAGETFIVYAKILFLYNGAFNSYDKSLPSMDSEIIEFDFKLFNDTFKTKDSVVAGCFIDGNKNISIARECFNKKTLVCFDTAETTKTFLTNLTKQFESSLTIDTLGTLKTEKFVAGVDFKLPLNTDALQFMFEDCLNDATSDSKNLIKEIFQDLANYSKTVPFVPFGALKTIVDDMVDKSHIFKLLVLKNKLAKFDKLGYFAATKEEAENLNKILTSKNAIIDLSKLDPVFQNRYLSIILTSIERLNPKLQLFTIVSNSLDKKNLKKLILGNISSTIVSHSKFKYINEIKRMFTNFIIEPNFSNNETFKSFAVLLKSMNSNQYLLVGEDTGYIPLISAVVDYEQTEEITTNSDLEEILEKDKEEEKEEEKEEDKQDEILESIAVEEVETIEETDSDETFRQELEVTDASIEAIEKRSEDFIEKVTEELSSVEISTELNIFGDDDTSTTNTVLEDVESEYETIKEEKIEENTNDTEDITEEALEFTPIEENTNELDITNNETIEYTEGSDKDLEQNNIQEYAEDFHTQVDNIQTIEIPEDISDLAIENEETEINTETLEPNYVENDIIIEENTEIEVQAEINESEETQIKEFTEDENIISEETEILPIEDEDEFIEIVELDDSEISEADIIVDFEDEAIEELSEEELDKAIVEDVDKVFTTMKEDSISDSDLDFIDELNNTIDNEIEEVTLTHGMEELTELQEIDDADDGILEPLEEISDYIQGEPEEREILERKSASTPIVPVYDAEIPPEDIVLSDDIEQGDTVTHAKYGNGIVEKMIKYGTKTLYSINFDNVGRRLLDPTLTEIKKS